MSLDHHQTVLRRLGGMHAVARLLKTSPNTVRVWMYNRGIPPKYWHVIAPLAGVSAEWLARTKPRDPRRHAKATSKCRCAA